MSLSHTISLAKLQEEKILDRSQTQFHRRPGQFSSSSSQVYTPRPPPRSNLTTNPSPTNSPNLTTPKTPPSIKRLSPVELQARREKGLCYHCDDRYQPGHRYKRQFYLLIVEPKIIDPTEEAMTQLLLTQEPQLEPITEQTPEPDTNPQISLHALMGHTIPQTLRVLGHIHNQKITILVDSGSTHNFI